MTKCLSIVALAILFGLSVMTAEGNPVASASVRNDTLIPDAHALTSEYERKSKLVAFLLSFFLGYLGADWFYLSQGQAGYIVAGLIKLFFPLLSCCFAACCGFACAGASRTPEVGHCGAVGVTACNGLIITIWYGVDWIRILADSFYDGNGEELKGW